MRRTLLVATVAVAAFLGCRQEGPVRVHPGGTIDVKGTIQMGAECPILVTKTGQHFSLGGDLDGLKTGDVVCVRGKLAEVSYCMAGEGTIAVESISADGDCGSP